MRGVLPSFLTVAGRAGVAALALALVLHGSTKRPPVRHPAAPVAARTLTDGDFARGFVMCRVGTGEAHDFAPPSNATAVADWRAFGAAEDWGYLAFTNQAFRVGTNDINRFRLFSSGRVGTLAGDWLAPLAAPLGIVPEANWGLLGETAAPSEVWYAATPQDSLVVTWRNALLDRRADSPVSFQAEFKPDGQFVYRYDLARLAAVTNVLIGASLAGSAWTTKALAADVTSLAFYPLVEGDRFNQDPDGDGLSTADELFRYGTDPHLPDTDFDGIPDGDEVALGTNPLVRDTDGDGLVDGSDPDPLVPTPSADFDGDGIPDVYEVLRFGGTNAVDSADERGANGFTVGLSLAAGLNLVDGAAEAFMSTNRVAAWRMTDGFAAQGLAGTDVVYERTFRIARSGGWEQYFVSSRPDRAGAWRLEGLALDWEDSGGASGTATASPAGDSLYLPVSTNGPAFLTVRLRRTAGDVACRTPLYLLAHSPGVEVAGARRIATSNAVWTVATIGEATTFPVSIDRTERPCRAALHPMETAAEFTANGGLLCIRGDGTLIASAPGVYPMPTVDLSSRTWPVLRGGHLAPPQPSMTNACRLALLAPRITYGRGHHADGSGLGYDPQSGSYYETYEYPLDSGCLWRSFHSDASGGYVCDCRPVLSPGFDFDAYSDMTTDITVNDGTATGTISVGGVEVWRGTAEHDISTGGGGPSETRLLSDDGCDDCGGCEEGNCDALEGADLGSLKFRIPLGVPRRGQVSGFAWFRAEGPFTVGIDTLQVLSRRDASVTDSTFGGTRTVACGDNRGRTLVLAPIESGIRITITDTASGSLEHMWELTNVNGSSSRIRLRKVSRLGNTMSDETYICDGGDWTRFDNVSKTSEELILDDSLNADGTRREERIVRDAAGVVLSHTISESRRFGSFASAVLRQTRYAERGWDGHWDESFASYYTDGDNPRRNGSVRLEWGNARAWRFRAYDAEGRAILTLDQHEGSECPAAFLQSLAADSFDGAADALAWLKGQPFTAIATVCDYAPLAGDAAAAADADRVRTESRYLVSGGSVTLVGRTWTRYTHGAADGHATVTVETTAAGAQDAAIGDPRNAVAVETRYDGDAAGVPLVLRGEVVSATDADGITTERAHSTSGGIVSCTARKYRGTHAHPVATVAERDATYGNLLREWSVHAASGTAFGGRQYLYDDRNRLRATLYADGSSSTNAYSFCRLLWSRDRTGRRVLRSAVTGEDHLYWATEEVSLARLPHDNLYIPYGSSRFVDDHYRVTQHFMDALGRETNTTVRVAREPGCATNHAYVLNRGWRTAETTAYPHGTSDYAVSTDVRGNVTTTIRRAYADREVVETAGTNGTATATAYRNGATVLREEWPDGKWRETATSSSYDANGCRVDAVTVTASDHGAVTLRTTRRDFLGRTVRETTPASDVAYAYDGAGSRVLTATDSVSGGIVTRLYNALGEAVGQARDGVASVSETDYEVGSNALWRVSSQVVSGSVTNASSVVRERLTGLSDELRGETELWRNGARVLHVRTSCAATNAVLTEVSESATAGTTVTRSRFGIAFETTSPAGTARSFFDPYGRVFYTERDGRSVDWIGRGDVVEYDTFHARGDGVYAEFYGYDSSGNRIAATNALGAVTVCAYDAAGRPVESGGAAYPVRHGYDTAGRRTSLSTTRDGAAWDATGWTFDPATGFRTAKTYADGTTVTYSYTPDGLPLRETRPSGEWRENVYDSARRIVGIVSSDEALDAAMTRDEFGNVTSESNAVSYVTYALDDHGNVTNEVQTVDGVSVSFLREFDPYGRPAQFARIGGDQMLIGYAADGQIDIISNETAVASYAYTSDRLDAGHSMDLSNGVDFTRTLARDGYRRSLVTNIVNSAAGAAVETLAYTYDALSRPVSRNADTFGYNERGEVVSSRGVTEDGYAYDEIGNLLHSVANSTTNTYVSNVRNQYASILRDSASPRETSYDLDGNMTQCGEWSYAYDSGSRLVSASSNGLVVAAFAYDAQGRRVKKISADGTHRYFYDGWLLVYEHVTRSDGTTGEIEYAWGKDVSGTRGGAAGIGGLLYLKRDGEIYVPHYDAFGNIRGYCDARGNVVASYTYDAFGNIVSQSGTMPDAFPFRHSTKYFDSDCGLYYYGYRYYGPQIMRWLTEDPIAESGGFNLYAFCGNNAISRLDLKGGSGKTLAEIEKTYRDMIAAARRKGKNVAADNLEYFLSGRGGTRILDWNWVRSFNSVISSESLNKARFESKLKEKARTLANGEKITFYDYYDAMNTANVFSEMYYASGTFTVSSYGEFSLIRNGCTVTIAGNLDHRWHDDYDWHIGLSAYIPGFGNVEDSDARCLEINGLARSFKMLSTWTQKLDATYTIRRYVWNTSSFTWEEPMHGGTGIYERYGRTTSRITGSLTGENSR